MVERTVECGLSGVVLWYGLQYYFRMDTKILNGVGKEGAYKLSYTRALR